MELFTVELPQPWCKNSQGGGRGMLTHHITIPDSSVQCMGRVSVSEITKLNAWKQTCCETRQRGVTLSPFCTPLATHRSGNIPRLPNPEPQYGLWWGLQERVQHQRGTWGRLVSWVQRHTRRAWKVAMVNMHIATLLSKSTPEEGQLCPVRSQLSTAFFKMQLLFPPSHPFHYICFPFCLRILTFFSYAFSSPS